MIFGEFEVTYRDGTQDKARITQYAHAVWQRWRARQKLPEDGMESVMARVMAWAELQRDAKAKTDFDAWDPTVDLVQPLGEPEPADPTRPATSAG